MCSSDLVNIKPESLMLVLGSIIKGKDHFVEKYEKNPEKIVDPYAIATVIIKSFPAPFPRSAIPGAISPRISNGIINERKLLNRAFKVTNTRTAQSGKNNENIIPKIIDISTLSNKPGLLFIIILLFFYNFTILF